MRRGGPNPEATRAFYDKVAERQNAWGSHGIPRASSIGNDLRQQYFDLLSAAQQREGHRAGYSTMLEPAPIDGESLWGMAEGNWQEPQVYQVLREQGYQIHSIQKAWVRYQDTHGETQVRVVPDDERLGAVIAALKRTGQRPFLTGHVDGIIEGGPDELPPTLLELKKATMFSFGGMVQQGIFIDKPGYRLQASANATSLGLDMVRFYVFTRDKSATNWYFTKMRSKNPILANPALYVEDCPIDERWVKIADYRALYVLDALEKGEMPEPDPGISPLNVRVEKNGEMSHLFPCGWCEWKEPCLQEMHGRGVNINEFVVTDDLRTKKEREEKPL